MAHLETSVFDDVRNRISYLRCRMERMAEDVGVEDTQMDSLDELCTIVAMLRHGTDDSSQCEALEDVLWRLREAVWHLLEFQQDSMASESHFNVQREKSRGPGRRRFCIPEDQLVYFLEMSFSVESIAKCLGLSRSTIHRRMGEYGLVSLSLLLMLICPTRNWMKSCPS